jgi:hypothetical protein
MRAPTALAAIGAAAHVICRIAFISEGRFFASEDDPYRAYTAFLIKDDPTRLISRLWVLGFEACHALFQWCGVPARWAGICVNTLVLAALLIGLVRITERLAPGQATLRWCVTALLLASPLTITLAHSSLSDLMATCLIVWAAEGFMSYANGGRLVALARAAVILSIATWVRYEPWLHVALLVPAVVFVEWRVLERRRLGALAIAALAWLGPVAWLLAQQLRYGDPFHFYANIVQTVETVSGPPARFPVLATHARSALYWFPHVVLLAIVAWSRRRDALFWRASWFFTATLLLAVAFQVFGGHQHATFAARLSYGIEIALLPWAAVGLDWCLQKRLRSTVAIAALLFSLTALRPAAMQDRDSVAFGLSLSRSEETIPADAKLLVERPLKRPPFGWASVGVLWGHWNQTVWVTPQVGGWTVVEARDVRAPLNLTDDGFGDWLDRTSVHGAWTLSDPMLELLTARWPCAEVIPYGYHHLLTWRICPRERP